MTTKGALGKPPIFVPISTRRERLKNGRKLVMVNGQKVRTGGQGKRTKDVPGGLKVNVVCVDDFDSAADCFYQFSIGRSFKKLGGKHGRRKGRKSAQDR